jgi:hypothetical protein
MTLAPLLRFVSNELVEIGRRERQRGVGESASHALILGSARPALISLSRLLISSTGPPPNLAIEGLQHEHAAIAVT